MSSMKFEFENKDRAILITDYCDLDTFMRLSTESTNGAFDRYMSTGMIGERVMRNFLLNRGHTVIATNRVAWAEGDIVSVDKNGNTRSYEVKTPGMSKDNRCLYFNLLDVWKHYTDFTYNEETRYEDIIEKGWLWTTTSDYIVFWLGLGSYVYKNGKIMEKVAPSEDVELIVVKNDKGDRQFLKNFFRVQLIKRYGWELNFELATIENLHNFNKPKFKQNIRYVKDFEVYYTDPEGKDGVTLDEAAKNKNKPYYRKPFAHEDLVLKVNVDWLVKALQEYCGEGNVFKNTFKYNKTLIFGEGDEFYA